MASDRRLAPSTISNFIVEDLLEDILKRLPIKTLIKLKCVCKSWNCLLSSRSFAILQLNFTSATTKPLTYLRAFSSYILQNKGDNTFTDLYFPLQYLHRVVTLGVIHGVVCISYALSRFSPWPQYITLMNPSIRKYLTVPMPYNSVSDFVLSYIGFGYDSSNDDFKLVWFRSISDNYKVFSVRNGDWETKKALIPEIGDSLFCENESFFVDGKIHWMTSTNLNVTRKAGLSYSMFEARGRRGRPHRLLVFNCELEEFEVMELPEQVWDENGYPRVLVYDGLLSVMARRPRCCTFFDERNDGMDYDLWTMKEYGVMSTWTKDGIGRKDEIVKDEFDVHSIGRSSFVFEESMLLMDIGKRCHWPCLTVVRR